MVLSEQQVTRIIEKHRIFGVFTAKGVIEASREVSKVECENFLRWLNTQKLSGPIQFEALWERYSKSTITLSNMV